jgi:peptidoglycan/xylan/chitin deacetylase (PgdA/CDA1 family)
MRGFFRNISIVLPSQLIVKGIGNKPIAPFYHLVSDNPPLHVKNLYRVISVKEFERDLDFLLKNFMPIDAQSLHGIVSNRIKSDKPSFFLSFDDGFREIKDIVAPILLRKGIPATFFVNPAFIGNIDLMYRCKVSLILERLNSNVVNNEILSKVSEILNVKDGKANLRNEILLLKYNQFEVIDAIATKLEVDFQDYLLKTKPYLTLDDLKALAISGFTIGGHGYGHPYFNDLVYDDQISEVKRCMQWLETHLPNQLRIFAYPFTDFGISPDLIKNVLSEPNNRCDITFGTSGIQPNRFVRHFQRIPMEQKCVSAKKIIEGEILYYIAKKSSGYYIWKNGSCSVAIKNFTQRSQSRKDVL